VDLGMRMDWRRGGFIILNRAWETIEENGALDIPEIKLSIPVE